MIKSLSKAFALACLPFVANCTPQTYELENGEMFRNLTENEISFAQTIFGNQLNYKNIKVYMRSGNQAHGGINNAIFMPLEDYESDYALRGDFSERSTFIHELTHVWQEQQGKNMVGRAILLFFQHGGDYNKSYDYDSSELPDFGNLGIEQQASIVEDYFQMRHNIIKGNNRKSCGYINRYEQALKPFFPAIQTPRLCRIA